MNINSTLAERGKRYGSFVTQAQIAQGIKAIIREHLDGSSKQLMPDQAEALDMIANKIGRIINGDANYADSWHDISGYAKLVADRLISEDADRRLDVTA